MDDMKSSSFGLPSMVGNDDDEFYLPPFGHNEFPVRTNVLCQRHPSPDVATNHLETDQEQSLPIKRAVSDDLVVQSRRKKDCQPICSIFGFGGKCSRSDKGKNKETVGLCAKKCSPACCPGKYWDIVGDTKNVNGVSRRMLGEKHNSILSLKSHHNPSSILPLNSSDEENLVESVKGVDSADVTAKSKELQFVHSPKRSAMNRRLPHDVLVSPHGKSNNLSHDKEICSSPPRICTSDDKKESNVHRILPVRAESIEAIGSKPRQNKFVDGGDIPADNLRLSTNNIKDTDVGNGIHNEISYGNTSDLVSIDNHGFQSCWLDRRKGKAIVNDEAAQFAVETKDKSISRNRFRPGKETFNISDISNDSLIPSTGIDSGMENTNSESINILKKNIFSNKDDKIGYLPTKRHETRRGDRDCIDTLHKSRGLNSFHHEQSLNQVHPTPVPKKEVKKSHRNQKRTQCERKGRLLDSQYGECSGFSTEDLEISSRIQSTRQSSNTRHNRTRNTERHHGSVFESITEIDARVSRGTYFRNTQAENFNVRNDLNTRIDQVESDEILAHQLQEQFNQELPGFRIGDEREASMAHLYAHHRHAPPQRRPDQFLASRRMLQFRRNLNHYDMDMEMQRNILETFEAALGNRENRANPSGLFSAHRDFTGDDYEMLLALDDNIHRHGATENQISTLPQSVVQSNSTEEVCTVCLEVPSAGDVIRHLPCLHKFHKECIDTWLKTKASCPICKSDIT